jgi:ESS family glutamate:Na+ symporter
MFSNRCELRLSVDGEGDVTVSLDATQTLAIAIGILFVGAVVISRVGVLRENNIPIPVVGGILFATLSAASYAAFDLQLSFDTVLKGPLMLIFFTTIGLGADLRQLRRGGRQLAFFGMVCVGYLVVQNLIGVSVALGMDLHPMVGLLSSSITLSGGHGTGAAYAERFAGSQNIAGTMELAMACATFGLVIGGLIGGPVAARLIRRRGLEASAHEGGPELSEPEADLDAPMSGESLLHTIFIILLCLIGGEFLSDRLASDAFTVPSFVWCLLLGVVVRNVFTSVPGLGLHVRTVDIMGSLSLGLFLAMALMSMQLWELAGLAGPLAVMLGAQTLGMIFFASVVTFRVMGSNYDAAVIAGGHCGFGLGATPTAIANIEALTLRYGPSPQAFLAVPLMGAFFIDFANAMVIQGYLALPLFGL